MSRKNNNYILSQEDTIFIKNVLRRGTIKWSGRAECLKLARKRVFLRRSKSGTSIFKFYWQCAVCFEWFKQENSMEVDHIIEIGSFTDWNEFVVKVFDRSNLQCLCAGCHLKKTLKFNSARSLYKRKKIARE